MNIWSACQTPLVFLSAPLLMTCVSDALFCFCVDFIFNLFLFLIAIQIEKGHLINLFL